MAVKFHNGGLPVNKRAGDSARKGAVRKRSQLKTKVEGEAHGSETKQSVRTVPGSEKERVGKAVQGSTEREG